MPCICIFYLLRFPKDKQRCQQWATTVHRTDAKTGRPWQPGPGALLCSEHFVTEDYIMQWGRKLLKPDALPSVFSFRPIPVRRKKPKNRSIIVAESQELPEKSSVEVSSQADAVVFEHSYVVGSPTKLRKLNLELCQKLQEKTNQLRNFRRRDGRLRGKIENVLQRLRQKHLVTSQAENLLEAYKDIPLELFKGKSGRGYTAEQKQFSTTLHYYSPAAYEYLRRQVKSLPNPRTIRSWLSSYNGDPGLTEQSFATIAENTSRSDGWAYKLCALHIDEMEVMKKLEFNRNTGKIHGFTDLGAGT